MNKMIELFDDFIMKAIVMTELFLSSNLENNDKLEDFTQNRERLLAVIEKISQQIDWNTVPSSDKDEYYRKLSYIKNLDMQLISKLQQYQAEIRKDIEQTFKQKENIKGYNLNDVK